MNELVFDTLGIRELTNEELIEINGGDKFMKDLGYAIGWLGGAIVDGLEAISENISELSPGTLYD